MVANKFLEEVDMAHEVRKECVFMCKYFHESVRELSDRLVCYQLISLSRPEEVQARVVQKVDNVIRGINHYPAYGVVCFFLTLVLWIALFSLTGGRCVFLIAHYWLSVNTAYLVTCRDSQSFLLFEILFLPY